MSIPVLATKLYIPPLKPKIVHRPRLIGLLNETLQNKLTLISASAGFGKTTIVSEWVTECRCPVAWLSLDEEHKDSISLLTYIISALQTIAKDFGKDLLTLLQSPQPPATNFILTSLLNEITSIPDSFVLVLDDYHIIDAEEIDNILTYILENIPPFMHLLIITREDPHFPLARFRGRGQMTELRASDLRFSSSEIKGFFNEIMNLNLSEENITALEIRTEGWIAGLQLAAISMRGQKDAADFINSFTGSHHFVLDYLIEEVLNQQTESIQSFLLRTSVLERMCGPLCDSVLQGISPFGQNILNELEKLNMFIIPLDNDRRWYRYHHLFAELLKQRLQQSTINEFELHRRASQWYEENELYIEAFFHAAKANDLDRSIRLIEGDRIPRYSRAVVNSILDWLKSLPESVMDNRPLLWITYGSVLLGIGQISGVEQKLQAAEKALLISESDKITRDLIGRIASMRAVIAVTQYDGKAMKKQSLRALEYLHQENISSRTTSKWTLGQGLEQLGDHKAARIIYNETLTMGQKSGNVIFSLLAKASLGYIEEVENHLHLANQIYREILQIVADQPLPVLCDVYLGLARINYQWNLIDYALDFTQKSIKLAHLFENTIDRFIISEIFFAQIELSKGEIGTASSLLAETAKSVKQFNFLFRISDVAVQQVLLLIKQGKLEEADQIAGKHKLYISQVRVELARENPENALNILESFYKQNEMNVQKEIELDVKILKTLALFMSGEKDKAIQLLVSVLALTEPEGFIRIYIDEGFPMFRLLSETLAQGFSTGYINKLLEIFTSEGNHSEKKQPLLEPLSQRELEILQLLSQGMSNLEICEKLFLALDTVKGHNRRIFAKLDVKNRTMAINKARLLKILNI